MGSKGNDWVCADLNGTFFCFDNLFQFDGVGGKTGAVVVICLDFVFVSLLKEILAQYKTKEGKYIEI